MRVALGADHAGFRLKEGVKQFLDSLHVPYTDFGTDTDQPVDYPDYALHVASAVASGQADRGILVCGTGIGMAIAANKVRGVRAAPVVDLESARLSREHNNANILALAGRLTPIDQAREFVRIFLETPFQGGRHQRRIDKIAGLEAQASQETDPDTPTRAGP
jgi:ribose 5-phosphate isomerase B